MDSASAPPGTALPDDLPPDDLPPDGVGADDLAPDGLASEGLAPDELPPLMLPADGLPLDALASDVPPAAVLAADPAEPEVPPEHDERYRPYVPHGAPDFLARRLASWLVPALVASAHRLQAAGVDLGPPAATGSLAVAVLEAVWTPRVDAATTERVVGRFRDSHAQDAGADALVDAIRLAGSDEAWARVDATRHRVLPAHRAPLKATAAREAALVLLEHDIRSTGDLLDLLAAVRAAPDRAGQDPEDPTGHEDLRQEPEIVAARERWVAVSRAWRAVPGQGTGRSWHRLLVLAGAERVVPDDDVRRFVSRCLRSLGTRWSPDVAPARASTVPDAWVSARLLELAGDLAEVPARQVGHLAWRGELLRGLPGRRPAGAGGNAAAPRAAGDGVSAATPPP